LFSGWRDRRSGASADREGLFVHERDWPVRCPRSLFAGRMFYFKRGARFQFQAEAPERGRAPL
jgi:hypothetical protein